MAYTHSKTSPYGITPSRDGMVGLYRHRNIPKSNDDRTIKLTKKYENRPDLLSYDLYGTPEFWWVFCVRNPNVIRDTVWDFVAGIEITVPSDAHLRKTIG